MVVLAAQRATLHQAAPVPIVLEQWTAFGTLPIHPADALLVRLQCCNRWLQIRLELIGIGVMLCIAFLIVLLRWPSDPGAYRTPLCDVRIPIVHPAAHCATWCPSWPQLRRRLRM